MAAVLEQTNLLKKSDAELHAEDLVERDQINEAIAIYQQIVPESARILRIIGRLYAHKKGDYTLAMSCYERALQLQDEVNDTTSEMLTDIGFAYQNRGEFDLALDYHIRALNIRNSSPKPNPVLIATNLFGIANAHWGKEDLSESFTYAQQALVLNESVPIGNDSNIASSLAILANIYHRSGDDIHALEYANRALVLLEGCMSEESLGVTSVLNNIGTIQVSAGLFKEAIVTFIRVLHICEKTLPKDHPRRMAIIQNVQQIVAMQEDDLMHSFSQFWTSLTKMFLA